MNEALPNVVSHYPSGFASTRAGIASQELQDTAESKRTRQRYFGDVVPDWRPNQEYSAWTATAGKVWPTLRLKLEKSWHHANVVDVYGSDSANVGRMTQGSWAPASAKQTVPHHFSNAERNIASHFFQWSTSKGLEQRQKAPSKPTDTREKAFVILERARDMLGRQRVRDARELLQLGAANYPEDKQIVGLLRAISPGRVSRTEGSVSDRSKEMAWIRENGNKYRNQWVAIVGSELVACANSLRDLLETLKRLEREKDSPVLQKIAPEFGVPC